MSEAAGYANAIDALFARDVTIFSDDPETQADIASFLGWLDLPDRMRPATGELKAFGDELAGEVDHVVLLGMGGSSLGAEVLATTIGSRKGHPEMLVLDSVAPDAIRAIRGGIDPARTLFIVASKSGTTIEPLSLESYFTKVLEDEGLDPVRHKIAITDPGTPIEKRSSDFRRVFLNFPDVGGRFSILSYFGLVPAALMGLDLEEILDIADRAFANARAHENNVAGELGAWMGGFALTGRTELTIRLRGDSAALGLWIEQLVAESTGKQQRGILPIVDEPIAADPANYSDDRMFVMVGVTGGAEELEQNGHPVFELALNGAMGVFEQFVIWEVATAIAGAVLRLDPFNQPNVESSKKLTRRMLDGEMEPGDTLASPTDTAAIEAGIRSANYIAILAWEAAREDTTELVQRIRRSIVDRNGTTTTFGTGPRYLHSTGQYHKGGGEGGVHIFYVPPIEKDLSIPGSRWTFGELLRAQAAGDMQALEASDRVVYLVTSREQLEELRDVI